jgi:hypothetical protein
LIRRDCLEKVGDFKDVFSQETQLDIELRKAGYQSKVAKNMTYYHLRKFSFMKAISTQMQAGKMRRQIKMPRALSYMVTCAGRKTILVRVTSVNNEPNCLSARIMDQLNEYFESMVGIPKIEVGERQAIETLINKEALLLAKFLRCEKEIWAPRIVRMS